MIKLKEYSLLIIQIITEVLNSNRCRRQAHELRSGTNMVKRRACETGKVVALFTGLYLKTLS